MATARSHEAVIGAAMDRVRADLFLRPGARSVVLAHAFVGGGVASDSERDISVGGVDLVPASVFDGVDYVALGHLHRPQTLSPRVRYSGSPLAYSFGEAGQHKQAWLVDLDAAGLADVRAVPLPTPRPLSMLTGTLAELLADPFHTAAEEHFVSARLTDPVRRRRPDACAADPVPALRAPGVGRRRRRPTAAATRSGSAAAAISTWPGVRPARPRRPGRARGAGAARPGPDGGRPRRGCPVRVHSLSFGPFADTVEVDFDDAGRDGLFLLWGPTGAGKTTLLDGVVYALYGTVPGARGEERRLRSDHAGDAVRTEVTCEVTLSGERIRVIRRPEQQRPKKRGSGSTTEQAKLTVQRWATSTWEPVSTRIDEGSDYLRTRLGLSAEQFCQVVLLPQGDFARFLRAEPEDRGRLLRTLFDVDRFARAEEWLAGERATARTGLETVRASMSTLLARVAQIADVDVPEDLAPELVGAGPGACVDPWVSAVRASARARLAAAATSADEAAGEAAAIDAELTAARAVAERHARRQRARRDLERLTGQEAELAPLGPSGMPVAAPSRCATCSRGRPCRPGGGGGRGGPRDGPSRVGGGRLGSGAHCFWPGRCATRPQRCARCEVDRAATLRAGPTGSWTPSSSVWPVAARRLPATPMRGPPGWPARNVASRSRRTRRPAAGWMRRGRPPRPRSAPRRPPSGFDHLVGSRAAAQRAREASVDARERWVELRAARLDGMAAELAAQLTEGTDCPVCGAVEHPRPATHEGPVVTADDEQRARDAVDRAEGLSAAALAVAEEQERELAALRARAGEHSEAELAATLADQEAAFTSAGELAADLDGARRARTALVVEREAAAARLAADREDLQARTAERDSAHAGLTELDERLTALRGQDRDLPTRVRRLEDEAERCEAVLGAEGDELRARTAADTARLAAERRAADAGFGDVLAAAAALPSAGRLAALDRRIDEHDRLLSVVRATLAEPELADLGPAPTSRRSVRAAPRSPVGARRPSRAWTVPGAARPRSRASPGTSPRPRWSWRSGGLGRPGRRAGRPGQRPRREHDEDAPAVLRARRPPRAGGRGRQPAPAGDVRRSLHVPAQRRPGPARRPRRPRARRAGRVHRRPPPDEDPVRR